MTSYADIAPQVSGEPGHEYVQAALKRAGLRSERGEVTLTPLDGGRSGASVYAIRANDRRLIMKVSRRHRAFAQAMGLPEGSEGPLWLSGATRELPAPLRCPTLDVAWNAETESWWILMDDVADHVVDRRSFGEPQTRTLLDALARLHARYWGDDATLAALPVTDLDGHTRVYTEAILHLVRGADAPDWAPGVLEEFSVLKAFVPTFLEALEPADAELYLDICASRQAWIRRLDTHPKTLVHGDLRRANVSFGPDAIAIFDWEFAARCHAVGDLQWHWMLQFWAYPPADGRPPEAREPLRQHYLAQLEAALGRGIDREAFDEAWELGWLRIMVQLGYCIIDPLIGDGADEEARAQAVTRAREAVAWMRRIADARL